MKSHACVRELRVELDWSSTRWRPCSLITILGKLGGGMSSTFKNEDSVDIKDVCDGLCTHLVSLTVKTLR